MFFPRPRAIASSVARAGRQMRSGRRSSKDPDHGTLPQPDSLLPLLVDGALASYRMSVRTVAAGFGPRGCQSSRALRRVQGPSPLAALPTSRSGALPTIWLAAALAQNGQAEEAFARLEEALDTGYRDLADLKNSPWYEPLRKDPRFARLLLKHGVGSARPMAMMILPHGT